MNKNIEIKKIQVNNWQELIAKAREYKNSSGEWKLLERYFMTRQEKADDEGGVDGIIISNGSQKVEIFGENKKSLPLWLNWEKDGGSQDNWNKLVELFPETYLTKSHSYEKEITFSGKTIKKGDKKYFSARRLVAWSVSDIAKIMSDFCLENRAKIDQSMVANKTDNFNFSSWVEVGVEPKKDIIYIWVGEREKRRGYYNGGGELEICIRRQDLEKYSTGDYDGKKHYWKDMITTVLASELRDMRLEPFWTLINSGSEKEISTFTDYQVGFSDFSGHSDNKTSDLLDKKGKSAKNPGSGSPKPTNSPTSNFDQVKEQVRRYMEQNDIFQLTLDNGKLIIEYNKTSKKEEKEINSEDLKTIQNYLKEHNNSINYQQLKPSSNSSATTNQTKKTGYIPWVVGGGILGLIVGILVYGIIKKRKVKQITGKKSK